MHPQARDYVAQTVENFGPFARVLEIGGRNVNGSVRDLFPDAFYHSVDIEAGDGVDEVADFGKMRVEPAWECVVCCEVLEHCPSSLLLIMNAYRALVGGGVFICTAAGVGRAPHSAIDGGQLRPGEHYRNISEDRLDDWLFHAGFTWWTIDAVVADIRCVAGRTGAWHG